VTSEVRRLGESDLDAFFAIRTISYPGVDLEEEEYRRIIAKRIPHSTGLFVGNELACVATMWRLEMNLGGAVVPMGGLAGVASAPERRRGGLIRTLLIDGLARLHEQGVGWSLEYPFDPRFYRRLGWQSVPSGCRLEIPSEYLFRGRPPVSSRRLPLAEFATQAPTYEAWAGRYNFTLTRRNDPRESWSRIAGKQWLYDGGFLYAFDEAYLLFTLSHENDRDLLVVEDFAYATVTGREQLFAFIGSMHGQAASVRMFLPDDDPITLDHRTRHLQLRGWPMQARVVDLAAALAPLCGPVGASFRIRVRDEQCRWNDGTFQVRFGERGTTVEPAAGPPDAELPIQTLPLLVCGAVGAEAALAQGQASGDARVLAALAALGRGRTPFMPRSDAF
jgi:predicted acetyltransferase